MKVCDLTQFYSPVSGGVRRYIEQKVAYIRRHRPDCQHVLVVPGKRTECVGDDVAKVYTIESPMVSRTSRYRILLKLHLVEEVLEKERPDIIESGDPYQLAWKAIASGDGLDIPVIGFYHSHFPEAYIRSVAKFFGKTAVSVAEDWAKRYVKTLYNQFHRTLVPSPNLVSLLQDWGVERVEGIDLGVDDEVFVPSDIPVEGFRREHEIPEDARLLLYVGRLASEKNVVTLFDAFDILHRQSPGKYHLLVVGDGSLRSSMLRLKESTNAVSWMEFCSDPYKLAEVYRSADLFVHPGVQETFGLVTLESQACGTPVIGIRGSYMDRIIFSNQVHWAAENTPQSLAAAIENKFGEDLHLTGLQASHEARTRYSWKSVFGRMFGIYDDVIANYHP
ncbi:alpha-1,6-mannosyltransferase [Terrimicrobium sacchariphilum]|uniref:Alpha-1,6-mannosyltransferase n=1 Tax=Terrimicrobium sacchariphilum TaxID=690879 RepID=A0A146G6L2_TERSA|nr:glycosyltransferase [Terrimicrobium sacchariphilum]GAT33375.1 alpha-1,6-mannosyltransferase [Terrimicrobium sacchariphilum]